MQSFVCPPSQRPDLDTYDAPLLITGCPRTGTTALAECLSRHRDICILPEACVYDLKDTYLASRRAVVWQQLPFAVAPAWKNAIDRLPRGRFSNAEMRTMLFDGIRETKPFVVYGDKLPQRYLEQMRALCRHLPKARFVVTIRDGRDVVASQLRWYRQCQREQRPPEWWMRDSVRSAERVWLSSMLLWERLKKSVPGNCWLEVKYEFATSSRFETLARVCSFLGISYKATEFQEGLEHYRPIHVGQWRKDVPDMEQRLSTRFRRTLERWGYV